jgi:hypothetical protein
MKTPASIESQSTRHSSLFFWKPSPIRALLPIFVIVTAALFSIGVAWGQETNRYTKVANQLVELINAGDYAGIQTNFNKQMDAALPLDKSSAFFSGLTRQMGKIEKLGEPQSVGGALVYPAKFEKGTLDMQFVLEGRRELIAAQPGSNGQLAGVAAPASGQLGLLPAPARKLLRDDAVSPLLAVSRWSSPEWLSPNLPSISSSICSLNYSLPKYQPRRRSGRAPSRQRHRGSAEPGRSVGSVRSVS